MNIGILQSAGIAGNIIELALSHPEPQDVFTPIIYSKENGNDKNVSSDLKFGNISGVTVAPGSATEFNFPGTMTVYVTDHIRLATVFENTAVTDDETMIAERIQKAWMVAKRDFLSSLPRVALLATNTEMDNEVLAPLVAQLASEGVGVFGPYAVDEYIEQQQYQHFDITLAIDEKQTQQLLDNVTERTRTKLLAGLPMVMTTTDYSATFDFESVDISEPVQALRQALYVVMEVCRNRAAYDEAHRDPLPKIYHERRDDSEKVRFAVKKIG